MSDIEIAREAAAQAQGRPDVAAMIRSGKFDAWPNVQGALNAIRMLRRPVQLSGKWAVTDDKISLLTA